ncbi:MAG: Hsp20/alpha crystallin family protein [Gemmatimonadales bacterium]|jgi:HSP20 family protein
METGTAVEKRAEGDVTQREPTRGGVRYRPAVDIVELPEELRVMADVPGASKEGIDINFEKGVLTIHAKVEPRHSGKTDYLLREYGVGDYYRVFTVSENVDASKINAEYADGILTLHLPKSEAAQPRKIQVRSK